MQKPGLRSARNTERPPVHPVSAIILRSDTLDTDSGNFMEEFG